MPRRARHAGLRDAAVGAMVWSVLAAALGLGAARQGASVGSGGGSGSGASISMGLLDLLQRAQNTYPGGVSPLTALDMIVSAAPALSATRAQAESLLRAAQSALWVEEPDVPHLDIIIMDNAPLGVLFAEQARGQPLRVQELRSGGAAMRQGVQLGDELIAVNYRGVHRFDMYDLGELLETLKAPKVFRFRRRPPPAPERARPDAGAGKARPAAAQQTQGRTFRVAVRSLATLGVRLLEDLSVADVSPSSDLRDKLGEGDVLVSINGKETKGLSMEATTQLFRSELPPFLLEFFTRRAGAGAEAALDEGLPELDRVERGADHRGAEAELVLTAPPILAGSRYRVTLAEFGPAPSCAAQNISLLDASAPAGLTMGCRAEAVSASAKAAHPANALMFVLRGDCPFAKKAHVVAQLGGRGLVVVTRSFEKLTAMPAAPNERVAVPAAMMSWSDGIMLASLLRAASMEGALRWGGCDDRQQQQQQQQPEQDKDDWSVELLGDGRRVNRQKVPGTVELLAWSAGLPGDGTVAVFGIAAGFGPKWEELSGVLRTTPSALKIAPGPDHTGCEPLADKDYAGSAILFVRGGCAWGDKALNAQRAGAKAYLVATDHSDRHKLQPMPAAPDQAKIITIPGAMITKASGELLKSIVLPPQLARDPDDELAPPPKPPLVIAKLYRRELYFCNRAKHIICGID